MIVVGNLEQILLTVFVAIFTSAGYSILFYMKKYLKNGQKFDPKKFLRTLLIGIGLGILLTPEVPIDSTVLFDLMEKIFAGTISIEALLTLVARWYRWITGQKPTSAGKATYRPT